MTSAEIVALQAADLRLWLPAQTEIEAYLQRALRVLHSAIDGEAVPWPEPKRPAERCNGACFASGNGDSVGLCDECAGDSTPPLEPGVVPILALPIDPDAEALVEELVRRHEPKAKPARPVEFCGPEMWATQRKCCPDCTHPRTEVCEGCDGLGATRPTESVPHSGPMVFRSKCPRCAPGGYFCMLCQLSSHKCQCDPWALSVCDHKPTRPIVPPGIPCIVCGVDCGNTDMCVRCATEQLRSEP